MGERIIINPAWRSAPEFTIFRNPDTRDRVEIFSRGSSIVRFSLVGDGSLYVGDAYEFTHHDSHTRLLNLYGANPYWDGELYGPRSSALSNPDYQLFDAPNTFEHTTNEINSSKTAMLTRTSNYHLRERGILEQSQAWRRFTIDLGLDLPKIEPLSGQIANQPITASTRAFVVLHGDGHLYFFDPEMSEDMRHLDAVKLLSKAECRAEGVPEWQRGCEPVIGFRLGGNGNLHYVFSAVSDPRAFLLSNRNFVNCAGRDFDFEVSQDDIRMHRLANKSNAVLMEEIAAMQINGESK